MCIHLNVLQIVLRFVPYGEYIELSICVHVSIGGPVLIAMELKLHAGVVVMANGAKLGKASTLLAQTSTSSRSTFCLNVG